MARLSFVEVRRRIEELGGVIRRENRGCYYVSVGFDEEVYPTLKEVVEDFDLENH